MLLACQRRIRWRNAPGKKARKRARWLVSFAERVGSRGDPGLGRITPM